MAKTCSYCGCANWQGWAGPSWTCSWQALLLRNQERCGATACKVGAVEHIKSATSVVCSEAGSKHLLSKTCLLRQVECLHATKGLLAWPTEPVQTSRAARFGNMPNGTQTSSATTHPANGMVSHQAKNCSRRGLTLMVAEVCPPNSSKTSSCATVDGCNPNAGFQCTMQLTWKVPQPTQVSSKLGERLV